MENENFTIKVISHVKVENHVEYFVNINNKSLNAGIYFTEKFTNLRNLYDLMKKESKIKKFPSFPPNKLFGYEEEKFVIQRAKDLDIFFQEINKNPNYNKLPSFIQYAKSKFKQKNIKHNNLNVNETKEIKLFIPNERIERRAKLFNNKFLRLPIKQLTNDEYDYIQKENEKIVKKIEEKFINLDYDINISINKKNEIKYQKIFNDTFVDKNNINKYSIDNYNDKNFDLIGKNDDNIIKIEKNMDLYLTKKENKFKSLSNIIEPQFFFHAINVK